MVNFLMNNNIKTAMQLLNEGKVDQGRSIFLSIIENDSNNAMAHAGIATCYELELDFDESIYYFNLAINLESANYLFHYHLANVYLKKYESLINLEPDPSLINKTISSFQKSLKLNPDFVASLLGIGIAHIKSINHKEAIKYFDSVIELKPSISDSYIYKGDCYLYLDNFLEASKCYKLAIKKDGTNFRAYNNLGLCFYKLLNLSLARDYLNKALKINPNYSYAYSNLSSVYLTTDIEKSLKYINKAIALDSTQSSFYCNLSQCYMALGDVEKSKTSLMKALELNYSNFNIYYNLSLLNYSFSDDIIHFLITSSDNKLISPLNRAFIDNTLFSYYDNNKEYSKAYKYLYKSNSNYFNIITNNKKGVIKKEKFLFDSIKKEFKSFKKSTHNNKISFDVEPIFILGLPRSGTTLVEQIVSAHSSVYGAGERGALQSIVKANDYPNSFSNLSAKSIIELSNYYISNMSFNSPGNVQFITDKLPHNFLYIGLIKQLFPNAKIIHMKRNKMDNCLSIYSKLFVGALPWSYNWRSINDFYNLYTDLMVFWDKLFPNEIFHCDYQTLINDPDNYIKELLNYLDLKHESLCFTPHLNTRSITTASAIQVRDKINKSSLNKWDNYKDFFTNER